MAKRRAEKMPEATASPSEGSKRSKPAPVKIDGELADMLQIISKYQRKPPHDLLRPLIADWIRTEYRTVIRQLARDVEKE